MHDRGKSDDPVVPAKRPNNAQGGAAEAVEGRGSPKGNATSTTRSGHSAGQSAPSGLDRVRRVARKDKDVRFTALLHHVDVDRLRAAYFALRPRAAPGVDGVTWHDYGRDLEENLRALHARVHRGSYRAKPSRRVYIPKPDGRQRPLAIAALEGQDPAAGGGRGTQRRLRGGLPRLFVWVSAGTLTASRVGRARDRDPAEAGELGARPGFPGLLLQP